MTAAIRTLSATDLDLLEAARAAAGNSYSPFSNFPVGAALRLSSGEVITGTNVETASYGGTICAERSALVAARSQKGRDLKVDSIAIAGTAPGLRSCPPCGICRNMIGELAPDARVLFLLEEAWTARDARELMPFPFELEPPRSGLWTRIVKRRR